MARDIHDDRYIRPRLDGNVTDYSAGRSPRQTQHQFFPCMPPLHAAGVLRETATGIILIASLDPSHRRMSLDVNPVFARIFPLDKRDAYEKSLIPWMFIEFRDRSILPVNGVCKGFSSIKYNWHPNDEISFSFFSISIEWFSSSKILRNPSSWKGYLFSFRKEKRINGII